MRPDCGVLDQVRLVAGLVPNETPFVVFYCSDCWSIARDSLSFRPVVDPLAAA
jgi:hypothetical protein